MCCDLELFLIRLYLVFKDRVENFRQRRCNPAGGEKWLDHRSGVSVPLGTILQPLMRKRKSVTELGSAQDVGKCDRYVLTTQDKDSSGELETRLYKVKFGLFPSCS